MRVKKGGLNQIIGDSFTSIDLFSGAGGFSIAARNLGIRVLAAVDNYRHATSTYQENLVCKSGGTQPMVYCEDIQELPPSRIMSELGLAQGELDILMGGPPCQGFSSHRINNTGVNDSRNSLLLKYFEFVRALRPRTFIVENVPGLLWPRHAYYLNKFQEFAKQANYHIYKPEVLNARDYGVPQARRRVFILGYRSDIDLEFMWPPPVSHFHPESKEAKEGAGANWVSSSTVFAQELPANDPNAIHMQHTQKLIDVFASTPKNGGSRRDSCRILPCHQNHDGHKDCYGRIDPTKPGPTMTTACINPSKGRFVHPTENHGITVRHAARFQGFPDDFIFSGGLIASGIQIGNAVPIRLGETVLSVMIEGLLNKKRVRRASGQ